jgi:hypothetical protein
MGQYLAPERNIVAGDLAALDQMMAGRKPDEKPPEKS